MSFRYYQLTFPVLVAFATTEHASAQKVVQPTFTNGFTQNQIYSMFKGSISRIVNAVLDSFERTGMENVICMWKMKANGTTKHMIYQYVITVVTSEIYANEGVRFVSVGFCKNLARSLNLSSLYIWCFDSYSR